MTRAKYTKQFHTNIRIKELKEFIESGKKAMIYEPNPKFFQVYGYLRAPSGLYQALRYAIDSEKFPLSLHKIGDVLIVIRTDI